MRGRAPLYSCHIYLVIYTCLSIAVVGKSKRASVLVLAVENAAENFIERGRQIAIEIPDMKMEMLDAVEEVRNYGGAMSAAAREFSNDPCSSVKRANMVRASRSLLSAVTRLLVLADMVDVHLLLKSLYVVEHDLEQLRSVSSQDELMANMWVSEPRYIGDFSVPLHLVEDPIPGQKYHNYIKC